MTDRPDPAARIAELEAEVARLKADNSWLAANRELLKSIVCAKPTDIEPIPALTDEEIEDAMHGPRGESLAELIAEFGRKAGGS